MNWAVGVSATSAAIWWVCSACLASFSVWNTLGRVVGWIAAVDEGQAGRADLVAVHVALQVRRRVLGHDRRALQRDQRLLDGVVAVGEGDRGGPLRGERDLVDVEVELLRPRRVGVAERLADPRDLAGAEAHLLGHGERDRALVALAVGGVVADEPRRVGRGVGADGQHAGRDQLVLRRQARGRAGRRGGAGARRGRGAAAAGPAAAAAARREHGGRGRDGHRRQDPSHRQTPSPGRDGHTPRRALAGQPTGLRRRPHSAYPWGYPVR